MEPLGALEAAEDAEVADPAGAPGSSAALMEAGQAAMRFAEENGVVAALRDAMRLYIRRRALGTAAAAGGAAAVVGAGVAGLLSPPDGWESAWPPG